MHCVKNVIRRYRGEESYDGEKKNVFLTKIRKIFLLPFPHDKIRYTKNEKKILNLFAYRQTYTSVDWYIHRWDYDFIIYTRINLVISLDIQK